MKANLTAWIEGIGLLAPGMNDWPSARQVLNDPASYRPAAAVLPAPTLLPPAERRRASRIVKTALAVGIEAVQQAGADASRLATVFTSSSGDGLNCHTLCETLASADRQISPTRFHNSVHNAAAGYWGIATGAMAPSQVLCAYDASFAAGLLEAVVQATSWNDKVLLISYDAEYPEPIHSFRPIPDAAGVALLLSPQQSDRSLAQITLRLVDDIVTRMPAPALETLRGTIPAMRSLPMLELLARNASGQATIEYLAPLQLKVEVLPC